MHSIIEVRSLSFTVPGGSLFAFLGQNGAGKSTTINILLTGLLNSDEGDILYGSGEGYGAFKDQMGTVFQNNILDDVLTVEENLLLFGAMYPQSAAARKKRFDQVVQLLSLEDCFKKRTKNLSGGQRRKAEIARALWSNPQVLFFDEPTASLDPRTRQDMWRVLRNIRRESGMTLFLMTHYMEATPGTS
ncbi:MAG: ABC transporter ATP-binding protein [Oscillospiraceae bacterium]|jgi:multidrug/hemolysin transport system ATP-binding protein|nr:ABC transporter ATP-binding protein [Oscillospiraceae bacterium]